MDRYLFRGKAVIDGKWYYGHLSTVDDTGVPVILEPGKENHWLKVIPETVGQFTGLVDKNGVKIFEGDIVRYGNFERQPEPLVDIGIVEWKDGCFLIDGEYIDWVANEYRNREIEVIGNIHDNPELLEVKP